MELTVLFFVCFETGSVGVAQAGLEHGKEDEEGNQ
jgi:hypothetical protein